MPVVSNTSPILNLAIIGELSLLREQFGEILIPRAVLEELQVEENLAGSQDVRDAIKDEQTYEPNYVPILRNLFQQNFLLILLSTEI